MYAASFRDSLARRINRRLFYGWVVLAVAALGLFASGPGQSHIFSVFIGPISQDLGISRTAVASSYAFATLVAAFGLPYVGRLIDRFGAGESCSRSRCCSAPPPSGSVRRRACCGSRSDSPRCAFSARAR